MFSFANTYERIVDNVSGIVYAYYRANQEWQWRNILFTIVK